MIFVFYLMLTDNDNDISVIKPQPVVRKRGTKCSKMHYNAMENNDIQKLKK